ncbi:MAG: hypothetical protein WAX69_00580 [Victivallales bacterium]
MNAYYFRVRDTNDFFKKLKEAAQKKEISMKRYIMEACKKEMERQDKNK